MSELFKNKYRIKSTRLEHWDYSSNGAYFVTICTKNRINYLGKIINGKMELSEIGGIVYFEWGNTEKIRTNVLIDEFIVMPNHIHGIVIIENETVVETHCNASLRGINTPINKFGPQSNNLSAIVRGFKGATTNKIHSVGFNNFAWQSRFYERIIRNENELNRTREYIINNPIKWEFDRNRFN